MHFYLRWQRMPRSSKTAKSLIDAVTGEDPVGVKKVGGSSHFKSDIPLFLIHQSNKYTTLDFQQPHSSIYCCGFIIMQVDKEQVL